jgi:hypothetical protein
VRDQLEAARTSLETARTALVDHRNDDAEEAIRVAGRHTARAADLTGDPVFRAVAHVPLLGNSVDVVRRITLAADTVAHSVLPEALGVARIVDPQRLRRADGSIDYALLQQSGPRLDELARRTAALDAATGATHRRWVVGPVARGRADLAEQLHQLASATLAAAEAVDLSTPLLGVDRPRRFFVLVQQTSESRGTGGLPGGFAILEADRGRLKVTKQGTDADIRTAQLPPPKGVPADYIDLYGPSGAFDAWVNVNLSPDLPVVARVIADRWKHQTGQTIDGVVALDAQALAEILRGGGPLSVGDRLIRPEDLPRYLAIDQYAGIPANADQSARKDRLVLAARAVADRITRSTGSTTDLVRGLADAVQSGHLRMASDDPVLAHDLARAGVDGALPKGNAPLAYPVVYSATGGKLDYFLDRSIRYAAAGCTGSRRRSTVAVTLRNSVPDTALPAYLTILIKDGVVTQSRDNAVVLSVYGTRGATLVGATLDGRPITATPARRGAPTLVGTSEAGLPLWYSLFAIPKGQSRELVLTLDEPVRAGAPRVPEQPLARPLHRTVDVPSCG